MTGYTGGTDEVTGVVGSSRKRQTTIKVWDPLVRGLHWSLVTCFIVAYATGEEIMSLHEVAGYAIIAIVGVRILWGFVGTRYARFDDFVPGFTTVRDYVKDLAAGRPARYIGHNPLGSVMILAMLAALLITSVTGILAEPRGAAEVYEELHEVFGNVTLALVVVHVSGVVLSSTMHHENLVRAMITGRKRA